MSGRREGREFKGKLAAGNQLRSIASGEEPSKFPLNKMEGEWHNPNSGHNGFIEVELVRMDSPTEGTIKVELLPYCSRAETKITYTKKGYWKFKPVYCSNNSGSLSITAQVRQVQGKKRMEGYYGPKNHGKSVVLKWE